MEKELQLIAHNIRSAHNVGAIFRTADGAGVKRIYLTGYTDFPALSAREKERKAQKMLAKTALGAEKNIPWEKAKDPEKIIKKLKKQGFQVLALEKNAQSVNLKKAKIKFPCVLILGNEITGVEEKLMSKSDVIVSLPMRGQKESLNVSVATGIALYKILRLV
jgi:tRNA G18 (ribose-2'-O)-methylase SpoU